MYSDGSALIFDTSERPVGVVFPAGQQVIVGGFSRTGDGVTPWEMLAVDGPTDTGNGYSGLTGYPVRSWPEGQPFPPIHGSKAFTPGVRYMWDDYRYGNGLFWVVAGNDFAAYTGMTYSAPSDIADAPDGSGSGFFPGRVFGVPKIIRSGNGAWLVGDQTGYLSFDDESTLSLVGEGVLTPAVPYPYGWDITVPDDSSVQVTFTDPSGNTWPSTTAPRMLRFTLQFFVDRPIVTPDNNMGLDINTVPGPFLVGGDIDVVAGVLSTLGDDGYWEITGPPPDENGVHLDWEATRFTCNGFILDTDGTVVDLDTLHFGISASGGDRFLRIERASAASYPLTPLHT